jgi:hypothetical protein
MIISKELKNSPMKELQNSSLFVRLIWKISGRTRISAIGNGGFGGSMVLGLAGKAFKRAGKPEG